MNWSDLEVALVPPGVVTVTSTVPVPAGDVARHEVLLVQLTFVARLEPKWTALGASQLGPVSPVPVMVTTVPPAAAPLVGARAPTVGGRS